jgi:hypothetical protein
MITIGTFRNENIAVMSFAPAFTTSLLFLAWCFGSGQANWQRLNEHIEEVCWSPREIRMTLTAKVWLGCAHGTHLPISIIL